MSERGRTVRTTLDRSARSAFSVLLLTATLAACFDVDDDVDLGVELSWDTDPDPDVFRGAGCSTAGVDRMEWRLLSLDDDQQVEEGVDYCCPGGGPCQGGIDSVVIHEPEPGEYALDIRGFDADDAERWGSLCDELVIARFDESYRCEIPALAAP
jgi:hypothetical protein